MKTKRESDQEWNEREAARVALLKAGKPVRCSALATVGATVHVLFQTSAERGAPCVGYYMHRDTYHVFDYMVNATPEDYAKHGTILDAPPDFYFSPA